MFRRRKMKYSGNSCVLKMHSSAESLLIICSRYVAQHLLKFRDSGYLEALPIHIKDHIIIYVTRVLKGFHDDKILNALLHENLKNLNLSSSRITDESLKSISNICPKLEVLTMNRAEFTFSREALLQTIPALSMLQSLEICNCDVLDDDFLKEISYKCPKIDLLDIGGCKRITDKCVEYLKMLKLNKLNVSNTYLTDDFLVKLGSTNLNDTIEEINVSHCKITSDGLINLRWDKLKYIGFQGCHVNDLDFVSGNKNIRSIEWTIAK